MTDQLREALEVWTVDAHMPTRLAEIIHAARWKLEFPTDVQVEAAAQVVFQADLLTRDKRTWEGLPEWVRETYRATARAALEAAHNTGKDEG